VIRQAISCDICATEKRQTNHWFVAYEQSGELRVSGWNSRNKLRPGSKHLCGQTCLHKLVDEFMAKAIAARPQHAANADETTPASTAAVDASLTSGAAYAKPELSRMCVSESRGPWVEEAESSARLLTPPVPISPKPVLHPEPELVTMPSRPHDENFAPPQGEKPRPVSRNWRAEAWERERERELRTIENRPDNAERRRSSA
jgi:hypothetical protein